MSKDTKEIILAKRAAYAEELIEKAGFWPTDAKFLARVKFPLPKKTVPRVWRDTNGRQFRVVSGRLETRDPATQAAWEELRVGRFTTDYPSIHMNERRAREIVNLFDNPTIEVEDDAEVSPC